MTYQNPVYPHTCPDPFVFKHAGEYWCYFTGIQPDGRCFGILHSPDLVHWTYQGSALDPLPGSFPMYWAPEAVYQDGIFYLYYSVGDEETMSIRVATATQPAGPFIDSGRQLTNEQFAIDAHVFIDDDGRWYLFYAADFLDIERVGTGTVMDRMLNPFTLVGNPKPVTRAKYDWQIYHPNRTEKGGVRWHTVEGPFVIKHNGHYYQMFSGGNWQNDTYGVAYGVTDRLDTPDEWQQSIDGRQTPLVLRTIVEEGIIGPGHNSVVRGLDNLEMYCVYHRWQPQTKERVLSIDRLDWDGDRLFSHGPTNSAQPDPVQPVVAGFDAFHGTGTWQRMEQGWRLGTTSSEAQVSVPAALDQFCMEVSLRFEEGDEMGEAGLALWNGSEEVLRLTLQPGHQKVLLTASNEVQSADLPDGFAAQAFHLLRLEVTAQATLLSIDNNRLLWRLPALPPGLRVQLFSRQASVVWAGFALSAMKV